MTTPFEFHDHDLGPRAASEGKVKYELRPAITPKGSVAEGLYSAWIILDNPSQYNSYTTDMVKDVILSFRRASNAQDVVAVVFTGAGDRAFCTGGNTKEYAEYYAGRPGEYARYMRLFNDMVTGILLCDKPDICRSCTMYRNLDNLRTWKGVERVRATRTRLRASRCSSAAPPPKRRLPLVKPG